MESVNDIGRARVAIADHFAISVVDGCEDRDQLHEDVSAVVRQWLEHDMHTLFVSLYRLDVGEDRVRAIFDTTAPGDVADKLAAVIIERQLEKVATWRAYLQSRREQGSTLLSEP